MLSRLIPLVTGVALVVGICDGPHLDRVGNDPTYWESIHPLVQKRCMPCHAEAGPGPFPLDTYERARPHALLMSVVAASHTMPLGSVASDIESADWRPLSGSEILMLKQWVNTGAKEGSRPTFKSTVAPHYSKQPEKTLSLAPIEVPLTGSPAWRTIEVRVDEDFPLRHFELDWHSGRVARATELEVVRGDGREYLGRSMVGQTPLRKRTTPKTVVHAGDLMRFYVRIHPDGMTRSISPKVGLYRGEADPIPREWESLVPTVRLAPGETRTVRSVYRVEEQRWLETLVPPATPWIRRATLSWVHPEAGRKVLARFDVWRPDSYGALRFRPSLELPAGSRIEVEVFYDNTQANPLIELQEPVDIGKLSERQLPEFRLKLVHGPTEALKRRI